MSPPFLLLAACLATLPAASACAQSGALTESSSAQELASHYGFVGLHVSRINDGVSGLVAGDLDGDGRGDLAVIDNGKARIELLLQRRGDEDLEEAAEEDKVNALPDETWFRRDAFPTEEKVTSLSVADLDGDGRDDLLLTGDSGRLTVAFRGADDVYGRVQRLRLEESEGPSLVRSGDLDGDGLRDVVVLGKESTWLYRQREDRELAEAVALPNADKAVDDLRVADLDGDGLQDLLYVVLDSEWPFRWRLGSGGGAFGPRVTSRFTPIRSFAIADVDGDGVVEVAAVRRRSGRMTLLRFGVGSGDPETGPFALSAPRTVPFAPLKDALRRQVVLADLDQDGRPDLLAAEPGAARVVMHRAGAGWAAVHSPSFLGASHPCVADLDGDGRPEVVVAAPDENAVGLAALEADGRVGFPRALALPEGGELLALDAVSAPDAAVWLVLGDGKGRSRTHRLAALDADGGVVFEHALPELKTDPSALMIADLDLDGSRDALVFVPTELPVVLLMPSGEEPRVLDVEALPGLGLLDGVERRAVFHGDVDGDGAAELLVPGSNFVRAFHLDRAGIPQVVAQVNLADPGSQAVAAAAADLDGDGRPEVLVVERNSSTLQVHASDGGTWVLAGRVDLGDLRPRTLLPADLDEDGRTDVLLEGTEAFASVLNGSDDAGLRPVLDYETPLKDAYLDQLALGDVNGDGRTDVVMTDSSGHRLAIAALTPDAIRHALRFPVFEGRLFESGRGGREPREVLVADVTGDRRADIALVVHDRVIVYPQEQAP